MINSGEQDDRLRAAECGTRDRKDRREVSGGGLIVGTPPVIATVGHGTAFETAGKGKANPLPMREAIQLVSKICGDSE